MMHRLIINLKSLMISSCFSPHFPPRSTFHNLHFHSKMSLPTLILIHGSWHGPICYDPIIKLLHGKYKLKCIAITLPSTTGNPDATFKNDLDTAREAISNETEAGRDVIVLAHSYGGMVGNSAVKGFEQPVSATKGHVIGLILIASGFSFTGLAFMDLFLGQTPPFFRVNKETGFADLALPPRQFFYHDLSDDEAEYWVSQLTHQNVKALFEGGEHVYSGWMDVPTWYIGTIEDQGLPVLAQRMAVGMAREMGGNIVHREMQTSHSPFLSKPEETVGIILEAVEAFSGKKVARTASRNAVAVPEARLLQPLTWLKFGLPLLFGRIVGRGILIFGFGGRMLRSIFGR
ncbi:Alpha/beta hydrolase family-domain-containing protein [Podospora fimiseda]|uniref:Alpha/beta hydrolase family-domain-containing protein n=1 Tax=Podospora fimiseda TaxID=252190 RepID=A0AAN7BGJ6_9PEZI|nr:Alpha/beta hydrolase family-domain-containing protein [Podospora fimiseda]